MASLTDQIVNEAGDEYGTMKNRRGMYRPQFRGSTQFLHAVGELKGNMIDTTDKMPTEAQPGNVEYTAPSHPASLTGQVQQAYGAAARKAEEPWRREGAYAADLRRTHAILGDRPRASTAAPADLAILNFVPTKISTTTAVIAIVIAAVLTFVIVRQAPAA